MCCLLSQAKNSLAFAGMVRVVPCTYVCMRCAYSVYVLVKPWPFVVSDIYHTSEASVINVMTPQRVMV